VGDLLRQGSQWLEQQRTAHCSSPVTYRRGETEAALDATFGRTEYQVEDDFGVVVAAHVTDFLVATAEPAPVFGEPQPGDRIVADGVAYEVMSLGNQGHWRWSDPYRTTMRIHTKDVDAA
jgi:hypothetical protein